MSGIEVLSRTQRIIVLPHTSVSIVKMGPAGPQGPTGPAGPQGPTGPAGPQGLLGSSINFRFFAMDPESLAYGVISRNGNGVAVSFNVLWPDNQLGSFYATVLSVDFPGAVDAYTVSYGSPSTKIYTQPTVTRDPITGVITNRPVITEA